MKALKTVIIVLLVLQSSASFAQTKEETISWLKEKLTAYMLGDDLTKNIKLESIEECNIVFSYSFRGNKENLTLPTNIDSIDKEGNFRYKAKVVSRQRNETEITHMDYALMLQLQNREEDIYARVEKALKHLSTFCVKKKETF